MNFACAFNQSMMRLVQRSMSLCAHSVIIRREIAKALKMAALADSLAGREDIKDVLREASKALQETEAQQPGKNK